MENKIGLLKQFLEQKRIYTRVYLLTARYYMSKRKANQFINANYPIGTLFAWDDTREGIDYWGNLHREFEQFKKEQKG